MPHALREARECGPFFFWCRRRRININESVLCFQNAGLQDLSHPDSFRAMCSLININGCERVFSRECTEVLFSLGLSGIP